MAGVRIVGLRKRFDATPVLRGLDLTIEDRELVTLLGPSGCGKTTTLRCVAGLERPDGGEVYIGEEVVASLGKRVFVPPNRRDIGMVFQSYALWPHMSVFANVAYPLRVRRVARREVASRVGEALDSVGMEAYERRRVTDLSGGQQQRVALARALVARPRVLLLDEPLSNLDAKLRVAMRKEIRTAHERANTTSVYVTHDQAEAIALSDRVVVVNDGTIQQVGTPIEIYRRPANRFVAEFVGFENVVGAQVAEVREGALALALRGSEECVVWTRPVVSGEAPGRGARTLLAVRAEDLRLVSRSAGESAADDALPKGTIVSRAYAGERWEYGVELPCGSLTVRCPDEAGPSLSPGEQVGVDFSSGRVVVLPDPDREQTAAAIGGDESEEAITASPARR
jgi:iron(III) transport system ATP-binding protein